MSSVDELMRAKAMACAGSLRGSDREAAIKEFCKKLAQMYFEHVVGAKRTSDDAIADFAERTCSEPAVTTFDGANDMLERCAFDMPQSVLLNMYVDYHGIVPDKRVSWAFVDMLRLDTVAG